MNKLAAVAAALTLSAGIAMTVPAFAATGPGVSTGKTTTGNTTSTTTYSSTPDYTLYTRKYYTLDEYYTKPRVLNPNTWVWLNGYCYYITGNEKNGYFFKNGTTPDGYTVDADGRWTVNGVVQVDPTYGNKTVWAGYTGGYSNDEIWNYYKTVLLKPFTDIYSIDPDSAQKNRVGKAGFNMSEQRVGTIGNEIYRNQTSTSDNFMMFDIEEEKWTTDKDYAQFGHLYFMELFDANEIYLKAMLGDNEGGRIFNYLRSLVKLDTSKTSALYNEYSFKPQNFDFSKYNGGTTDYGRRYTITNVETAARITVY